MLGTSASNLLIGDSQALVPDAENNYQSQTVFMPEQNLTYVEYTDTGILQVPRNQTITDANLSLSSMWNPVTYQNTTFGNNQTFMWNGDLSDMEISPKTQNLILERVNTANTINDFEVASNVPGDGWLTNGRNGDVWTIVQNNSNLISN